jgi:hypothetical protein
MKTIHLHIGRGKTGTTAIQRWLAANRDAVLAHGFDYLLAGDNGKGSGHQQFAKSFITKPPVYMLPAKDPEAAQRSVHDGISRSEAENIIISSENFPLADAASVAAFFRDLPEPFRVKIIFFARSQDELAESEYNQMVKLKNVTESFSEYADNILSGCHYDTELAPWERQFGHENILCRIHNARSKGAITGFLNCLSEELVPLASTHTDQSNPSVGSKALAAMRQLNEVELSDRQRRYQNIAAKFAEKDLPALFMNSSEARLFRHKFAESNRTFSSRYLEEAVSDLGGRRYTDDERDAIVAELRAEGLATG